MSEPPPPDPPKTEDESPKTSTDDKSTESPQKSADDQKKPEEKVADESKASADEPKKASTSEDQKKASEEQKKGSADSKKRAKSPNDQKLEAKRQELKEKKTKDLEERKTKRADELKRLSKTKGEVSVADEIQMNRAGYEILRSQTLGSGRVSTIYGAKKKKEESELCVKLILMEKIPKTYSELLMSPKAGLKVQRFIGSGGEKKAAKCERFVRVFDIFLCRNKVFVFMEKCLTLSLETRLRTKDTITEFDAKKWGKQLAEAIDCLQVSGIAHRNIRPENIIFDKKYDIKLVGMGAAVIFWDESKQEAIPQPKEKPCKPVDFLRFDHLPPQCLNEDYDPSAVDVWSWAVVVCLCLHKQTPFDLKTKDFTPEEQWTQYSTKYQFPADCKQLLDKCFVTDPSARITSYDILRHKWLADKPSAPKKKKL